jgi:hypothetical protein
MLKMISSVLFKSKKKSDAEICRKIFGGIIIMDILGMDIVGRVVGVRIGVLGIMDVVHVPILGMEDVVEVELVSILV